MSKDIKNILKIPFTCEFCDKIFSLRKYDKASKSAKYCLNIQSERKILKKQKKLYINVNFVTKFTSQANLTRRNLFV